MSSRMDKKKKRFVVHRCIIKRVHESMVQIEMCIKTP